MNKTKAKNSNAPKAHALYAASAAKRWMNCPASVKRIDALPVEQKFTTSVAADEGTLAHELMEKCLLQNKDAHHFAHELNDDEDFTAKYSEEMREHVQGFVDFVRSKRTVGSELWVERRVNLPDVHPTQAFGTVDVAIIEPFGDIHIIDFKYGKSRVSAEMNEQLLFYACGVAGEIQWDFDRAWMTIYQPRATREGESPARSYSLPNFAISEFESDLAVKVEECENAKITNVVAGDWCFFCPAKINCPAITSKALAQAKLDFDDSKLPMPNELTPTQVSTILDKAKYLKMWIKAVEEYGESILKGGGKLPGWTLKPGRATRKWTESDEEILKVYPMLAELMTPASAEKTLKKMGLSKNAIDVFLKTYVVSVAGNDRLTSITNDFNDGENDNE